MSRGGTDARCLPLKVSTNFANCTRKVVVFVVGFGTKMPLKQPGWMEKITTDSQGTFLLRCSSFNLFQNLFGARRKIGDWRTDYNQQRPHSSLGYRTPCEFAMWAKKASYGTTRTASAWKTPLAFPTLPQLRLLAKL